MQIQLTIAVPDRAITQAVSVSGTSASTSVLSGSAAVILPTVDCFVIRGESPTATTSCLPLLGGNMVRVSGMRQGEKLAFITSGATGTVYVTEGV